MTNQNDFVIDNGTGLAVRTDIQDALQALAGNSSGNLEPSVKYAYQWWADSNAGVMKLRNSANNDWIEMFQLDGTLTLEDGSNSAPALCFRNDTDTGVFRNGANIFNIATGGVERVGISSTEVVVNQTGADVDFRIEGDTEANLFYLDASTNSIGIGTSAPNSGRLHVTHSTGTIGYFESTQAAANTNNIVLNSTQTNSSTNLVLQINSGTSAQGIIRLNGNNSIDFHNGASPTVKARITSAGLLLVGSTLTSNNGAIQGFIAHGSTAGESGITSVDTTAMAAGVGGEISFYGKTSSSGYNYLGHIRGIKENGTDTNTACALTFHTRPTLTAPGEKMRITSDGFLCIGTTDTLIFYHVAGDDTGTVLDGRGGIQVTRLNDQCGIFNRTGTDGTIFSFHNDGTCVGFISVIGSTTGYSTNCSDRAYKKNFEDWTEDALSLFKDLKPQKFNYITEDDSKDKTKGYVAQDLVANFPEAYPKNDNGLYVFNPSGMVVYLMKAIQQLEAKVAALEAA